MSKGEREITSKLITSKGRERLSLPQGRERSPGERILKDQTYKRESIKGEKEISRGREYSRIPDA